MKYFILANEPVPLGDGFYYHAPSLRTILKNENMYNSYIFLILTQGQTFTKQIPELADFSAFESLKIVMATQPEYSKMFFEALYFFTGRIFYINKEIDLVAFIDNDKEKDLEVFTEVHWNIFVKAVQTGANISDSQLKELFEERKYADEKTREMAEKFKKIRERVMKYKKTQQSDSMFALVSRFCAKSCNINIMQVWDLNYLQYMLQLEDVIQIESYDTTTRAMMAGAKISNLSHWSQLK